MNLDIAIGSLISSFRPVSPLINVIPYLAVSYTHLNNIDDKNGTVMFIAPTGTFNASSAIYTFEGDFTLAEGTEYLFLYNKGITAGKTITIEYYKTN